MFRLIDVQYLPDGHTLIVTGWADSRFVSGGGIWRSADGGATWSQPSSADPGCIARWHAHGIAVEPGTATVYVGTSCGVAISTNAGASWGHTVLGGTDGRGAGPGLLRHRAGGVSPGVHSQRFHPAVERRELDGPELGSPRSERNGFRATKRPSALVGQRRWRPSADGFCQPDRNSVRCSSRPCATAARNQLADDRQRVQRLPCAPTVRGHGPGPDRQRDGPLRRHPGQWYSDVDGRRIDLAVQRWGGGVSHSGGPLWASEHE